MEVIDGEQGLGWEVRGTEKANGTRESSQAWEEAGPCRLEPGSDRESGPKLE